MDKWAAVDNPVDGHIQTWGYIMPDAGQRHRIKYQFCLRDGAQGKTVELHLVGESGTAYRYVFVEGTTPLTTEGGNYAFLHRLPNGSWQPVYFGVADNCRARLANHERWPEAVRLGATAIAGHTTPGGDAARCAEERDLIRFWNPPLNTHHRSAL